MNWTEDTPDGAMRRREFALDVEGRRVPGALWMPAETKGPLPLVLMGHGGSQHKRSDAVYDIARPVTAGGGALVAIDGPVHGARRADGGLDGNQVLQDFRAMWAENPRVKEMVADWRAVIDALCGLPEIKRDAIGWFGISMGTAYGLPLCAADARVKAAMLGMWGTGRPHSEVLMQAARTIRCPVMFQIKTEDERFSRAGQDELYATIASADKAVLTYPGLHVNPAGQQLDDGLAFLARHLGLKQP